MGSMGSFVSRAILAEKAPGVRLLAAGEIRPLPDSSEKILLQVGLDLLFSRSQKAFPYSYYSYHNGNGSKNQKNK